MTTSAEIIAKNTEKLEAVIYGDVESATVAGVVISRVDFSGYRFHIRAGGLNVYGDEIKISRIFAYLKNDGITHIYLILSEE